jgi:hypothetical protein
VNGKHGIVEHKGFLVGEFLELALPVDFERGRTDHKARVSIGTVNDTDALQRLSQARLIAD